MFDQTIFFPFFFFFFETTKTAGEEKKDGVSPFHSFLIFLFSRETSVTKSGENTTESESADPLFPVDPDVGCGSRGWKRRKLKAHAWGEGAGCKEKLP